MTWTPGPAAAEDPTATPPKEEQESAEAGQATKHAAPSDGLAANAEDKAWTEAMTWMPDATGGQLHSSASHGHERQRDAPEQSTRAGPGGQGESPLMRKPEPKLHSQQSQQEEQEPERQREEEEAEEKDKEILETRQQIIREEPRNMGEASANMEVTEVFSPPRISARAIETQMGTGIALDLGFTDSNGIRWGFDDPKGRKDAPTLIRATQPKFVVGSPERTAFSATRTS